MENNFKLLLFTFFLICLGVGFYFSSFLIQFITSLLPSEIKLVSLNPSDGFLVYFWSALSIGFLLFSFFGGIYLWYYSKNILYSHERKILRNNIIPIVILFATGFLFGIHMYVNIVLKYFLEINSLLGLENIWSINVVFVSALMIGFSLGISFQLPIIIRSLIKFKIIKKDIFVKNKLIVLVVLLILSAIITPPDMISQLMVAGPLYTLFILSLIKI
ncbi:MAG: twin-arginine translocase subunit TatC [Candidatus ainarchaeum sp.]|nr:twin-arginine translocase subunit TatC [Candidatus ainarchaeum sp.]